MRSNKQRQIKSEANFIQAFVEPYYEPHAQTHMLPRTEENCDKVDEEQADIFRFEEIVIYAH